MTEKHPGEPDDNSSTPPMIDLAPPLLTHAALLKYLYTHGHFHVKDTDNFRVQGVAWGTVSNLPADHPTTQKAIKSWQAMRPTLEVDGIFGPVCCAKANNEATARCGLPDVMPRTNRASRWPHECKHDLTTHHNLDGLTYIPDTEKTINQAWDHGLQLWNQVADLTLTRKDPRLKNRIRASAQRMSRNILAWSQLPYDECESVLDQAYNSQVRWHWHLLWTTICHEIGHAIGLGHGGRGIMQPAHDSSVKHLGEWDVKQVVARYGLATPARPPEYDGDVPVHHGTLELFSEQGLSVARFDITPSE